MHIFGWEEDQLEQCFSLLDNILVPENAADKCVWLHNSIDTYSIKDVYLFLLELSSPTVRFIYI